jgi:hypothetical protein
MKDVPAQLAKMQIAVLATIPECCQEILEWENTGVLKPKGKVQEAAKCLTHPSLATQKLNHVANFVKTTAMEFVIHIKNKR